MVGEVQDRRSLGGGCTGTGVCQGEARGRESGTVVQPTVGLGGMTYSGHWGDHEQIGGSGGGEEKAWGWVEDYWA